MWTQCTSHALHHQLLAHSSGSSSLWTLYISKLCFDLCDCGGAGESGVVQQGIWVAASDPRSCQPDWSSSCRWVLMQCLVLRECAWCSSCRWVLMQCLVLGSVHTSWYFYSCTFGPLFPFSELYYIVFFSIEFHLLLMTPFTLFIQVTLHIILKHLISIHLISFFVLLNSRFHSHTMQSPPLLPLYNFFFAFISTPLLLHNFFLMYTFTSWD